MQAEKQIEEKRRRVIEEQRHVTEKVSDLCRYIGFGIAAVCYAVFTSSSAFAIEILNQYRNLLLTSAFLAVLTIFFDYIQFLCGYFSVREALDNKDDDYNYKLKSLFYRGRFVFFYTKQFSIFVSVVVLLYTLFAKLGA